MNNSSLVSSQINPFESGGSRLSRRYAEIRNYVPPGLFNHLEARGISIPGLKIVDIASGCGALVADANALGGCAIGIEASTTMLNESRSTYPGHTFVQGTAEDTGLPSSSIDLATVFRAWHWFDRGKAIAELTRVLTDDGIVVIGDSGISGKGRPAQLTFDIVKHNMPNGVILPAGSKANSGPRLLGFPVLWFEELERSGFQLQDLFYFTYNRSFSTQGWRAFVESLSWLSFHGESERTRILDDIVAALQPEALPYDWFTVEHKCTCSILRRL
jgi:SAM-dependent methyltransferase